MLAWAAVLLVLYATNWIWEGAQPVQIYTTVFAIVVITAGGVWQWLARREAIRKGAPHAERDPDALPEASLGAVGAGVSVGIILYGFAWAHFLVYFGAGLLVLSLGRLALELRAQRRSVREVRDR
jgi:hypothetical protein